MHIPEASVPQSLGGTGPSQSRAKDLRQSATLPLRLAGPFADPTARQNDRGRSLTASSKEPSRASATFAKELEELRALVRASHLASTRERAETGKNNPTPVPPPQSEEEKAIASLKRETTFSLSYPYSYWALEQLHSAQEAQERLQTELRIERNMREELQKLNEAQSLRIKELTTLSSASTPVPQ